MGQGSVIRKKSLEKELPFEKFKAIIKNTHSRFKMVHLAGLGEVTLYPHFIDAVRYARKLSDNIKITTNSNKLNPDYIDELEEAGLTEIEMSIIMQERRLKICLELTNVVLKLK